MQIKRLGTKVEDNEKQRRKKGDKRIALAFVSLPICAWFISPGRRENLSQPWKITY